MNATTKALHEALIRCAKGMVAAWEKWLRSQAETTKPD